MARSRVPRAVIEYQRQALNLQRTFFENSFNALSALADQQREFFERTLGQTRLPEETLELVQTWQQAASDGRQRYKEAMDQSFDAMEQYLNRRDPVDDEPEAEGKTKAGTGTKKGKKARKARKGTTSKDS